MAITDPTDNISAQLTDVARQYIARATIGEVAFKAIGFSVGRGGYQPADPVHIIALTGAETALTDQVYPNVTGEAAFQQIDMPGNESTVVYFCRLPSTQPPSNADYGLGELGVWAEILNSNVPMEIGQKFLLAIAHFPIKAKTNRDTILFRTTVQY